MSNTIEPGFTLAPQLNQDCLFIADLPLCRVLLMNESQFPWFILVPRSHDVTEICQLSTVQQQQLHLESQQLSLLLKQRYPDCKLNIASLGNVVSQLHIHHVARFVDDAAWPAPVWGNFVSQVYDQTEQEQLINQWRKQLERCEFKAL